jgi:hypothetical protein
MIGRQRRRRRRGGWVARATLDLRTSWWIAGRLRRAYARELGERRAR